MIKENTPFKVKTVISSLNLAIKSILERLLESSYPVNSETLLTCWNLTKFWLRYLILNKDFKLTAPITFNISEKNSHILQGLFYKENICWYTAVLDWCQFCHWYWLKIIFYHLIMVIWQFETRRNSLLKLNHGLFVSVGRKNIFGFNL